MLFDSGIQRLCCILLYLQLRQFSIKLWRVRKYISKNNFSWRYIKVVWVGHIRMGFFFKWIQNYQKTTIHVCNWSICIQMVFQNIEISRIVAHNKMAIKTVSLCWISLKKLWLHLRTKRPQNGFCPLSKWLQASLVLSFIIFEKNPP